MSDFFPRQDTGFHTWAKTFTDYARDNFDELDLNENDVYEAMALVTAFQTAFDTHNAAQNAAKSAAATKAGVRETLETALRKLSRQVQANPGVTDAERKSLGVTVRDTVRTPVPEPATTPRLTVDISERLRHTLGFYDAGAGGKRAKPAGVSGCEIWVKVGGDRPRDENEMRYVGRASRAGFVVQYAAENAGKTAHYWTRWVNTRGVPGAWGDTVSATIAA